MSRRALSVPVAVCALWLFLGSADAQQAGPAAGAKPAQGGLQVRPATPQATATKIESIKEYRQGEEGCPYVRRLEDWRRLDLSKVDFDADVLARVNDKDITRSEWLLWYCLNAGQNGILKYQLEILTRKAVERLREQGEDTSRFEISDEDVKKRLEAEETQMRAQGEEALAAYRQRVESTIGWDRYRDLVRAHLLCERLLLPPIRPLEEGEEPQALPVETADLLSDQPELRDFLNKNYLTGTEFNPMFRTTFLRMLQQKLIERADIRYALEEKLPEGVYMTVEGEPVTVDDVLAFVKPSRQVKEGALHVAILYHALDDALRDAGVNVSREEFERLFEAHKKEFEGTLFPLPNLIQLRGFRNMSEYRQYYRRRVAFEKMLRDVVTDEDLRRHHELYGRLFYESGKVDCDVFWVSLVDTEEKFGLEGEAAWAKALERIEGARDALLAGKSPAEVRAEFCSPDKGFPKGNTGFKARNELRQAFSENDYIIFTLGYSLADDVFYNRVEGEVVGPVRFDKTPTPDDRGVLGYMLVRPRAFMKSLPLKSFEAQRPLVETDYYDLRFTYFAHECLKNAKIEFLGG